MLLGRGSFNAVFEDEQDPSKVVRVTAASRSKRVLKSLSILKDILHPFRKQLGPALLMNVDHTTSKKRKKIKASWRKGFLSEQEDGTKCSSEPSSYMIVEGMERLEIFKRTRARQQTWKQFALITCWFLKYAQKLCNFAHLDIKRTNVGIRKYTVPVRMTFQEEEGGAVFLLDNVNEVPVFFDYDGACIQDESIGCYGTRDYLPPEYLLEILERRDPGVTPLARMFASDWWSLGMVLLSQALCLRCNKYFMYKDNDSALDYLVCCALWINIVQMLPHDHPPPFEWIHVRYPLACDQLKSALATRKMEYDEMRAFYSSQLSWEEKKFFRMFFTWDVAQRGCSNVVSFQEIPLFWPFKATSTTTATSQEFQFGLNN